MNDRSTEIIQEVAVGAWARLRNIIGVLDRVDRLETSHEYEGWLAGLAHDEDGLALEAREFLLRALKLSADPLNSRILDDLEDRGSTISTLSEKTGLGRIELVERLNELARAGLTLQSLEGEEIAATKLARGLDALMEEIVERIVDLAESDPLLNPRTQTPKMRPGVDRLNR